MKNVLKNRHLLHGLTGIFAVTVIMVGAFSVAPLAHAQEDGISDGGDCCGAISPTYIDDSYTPDYENVTPSYIDSSYTPDYSYTPSSNSSGDYFTGGYMTSGFLTGGYMTGGYMTSSYPVSGNTSSSVYAPDYNYTPTYDNGNTTATDNGNTTACTTPNSCSSYDNGDTSTYAPVTTTVTDNGNTSTYAPVSNTTNTCTADDSCDTSTSIVTTDNWSSPATPIVYSSPSPVVYNNPAPIVYNTPAPVVAYNTTPTLTCNTCGCLGYPVCPTVAYSTPTTPYITLSQVPYTGLDLGFWGTIAYWGFLIFWCLVAAYLIVIKRVQNRIYRAIKNFLFGAPVSEVQKTQPAPASPTLDLDALTSQIAVMLNPQIAISNGALAAPSSVSGFTDTTDEFILSQIHRPLGR